jgi:TetR/AcrR family transcriptional regulator, regulator of cefoperazone and chloramphenicol sensitivity
MNGEGEPFAPSTGSPGPGRGDRSRHRLLEAAGEEFADRGFHGASVRGIAERAEANVAAISYHFGGKQAAYREAFKLAAGRFVAAVRRELSGVESSEERVGRFLGLLLTLEPDPPSDWCHRLVRREFLAPEGWAEDSIRRLRADLAHLIWPGGPGATGLEPGRPCGAVLQALLGPT